MTEKNPIRAGGRAVCLRVLIVSVLACDLARAVTLTYDAVLDSTGTAFSQELTIRDNPNVFDVGGVTHWEFPITASSTTTSAGTEASTASFIGAKFGAYNDGSDLHYSLIFPIAPILAGEPLTAFHEVLINSSQPPAIAFDGAVAADAALALQLTGFVDLFAQIVEGPTVFDSVTVDASSIVVVPEPSATLLAFAGLLTGLRRRR